MPDSKKFVPKNGAMPHVEVVMEEQELTVSNSVHQEGMCLRHACYVIVLIRYGKASLSIFCLN